MDDVIYNLLLHLPIPDIGICSQINKQFNKVTKYEQLWKNLYLKNYLDKDIIDTYYETCKTYCSMLKLNKYHTIIIFLFLVYQL